MTQLFKLLMQTTNNLLILAKMKKCRKNMTKL